MTAELSRSLKWRHVAIESDRAQANEGARVVCVSLVVTGLISCVIGLVWTVSFMTNDDTNMAAFASGDYTGHPSAHLVFVSAPLGVLLAALHDVVQRVPWYALMLISIGVCSTGSLVAIAYLRRDQIRTRGQLAVVVLFIVLLPVLVLRPSFTVAAIVLCTTGIIAVAAAARSERHARLLICFGSIVLGIGAMVRFDSFMGVVAAFLPFIAVAGVSIGWRRLLIAIAIASGLLAVSSLSDHALNSSPEWSAYMKFNQVRGELSQSIDFERAMADPTDPAVAKLLADIGWTVDDVVLFNSWLFYDPKVYSTDHLSKVVSLVSGASYNAPLSDSVLLVFRSQRPLWILSVSLGVAAAARRRWRNWVLMLVQLAWCAAVFSYIAASQRFPDRISIPFYLALGIVLTLGMPLLLHERNPEQHLPTDRRQVLPALVAVACVLVTFHDFSDGFTPWQISGTNQVAITQYHKQLDGLKQRRSRRTILMPRLGAENRGYRCLGNNIRLPVEQGAVHRLANRWSELCSTSIRIG